MHHIRRMPTKGSKAMHRRLYPGPTPALDTQEPNTSSRTCVEEPRPVHLARELSQYLESGVSTDTFEKEFAVYWRRETTALTQLSSYQPTDLCGG